MLAAEARAKCDVRVHTLGHHIVGLQTVDPSLHIGAVILGGLAVYKQHPSLIAQLIAGGGAGPEGRAQLHAAQADDQVDHIIHRAGTVIVLPLGEDDLSAVALEDGVIHLAAVGLLALQDAAGGEDIPHQLAEVIIIRGQEHVLKIRHIFIRPVVEQVICVDALGQIAAPVDIVQCAAPVALGIVPVIPLDGLSPGDG